MSLPEHLKKRHRELMKRGDAWVAKRQALPSETLSAELASELRIILKDWDTFDRDHQSHSAQWQYCDVARSR